MPFRAVLFDFDGTLADSYAAITASVNHVRAFHHLPLLTVEQIRGMVGHGLVQLMEEVVPGGDPEVEAARYREHHPSVMIPLTHLLPGTAETLALLAANGIRMGICSNKPSGFTRALCVGLNIDHYFTVIFGPEEAGAPKPDPAMLVRAAAACQVSLEETLYVGDMTVDIETAHRAGVVVWAVPSGSCDRETLEAARPTKLLADLHEFARIFAVTATNCPIDNFGSNSAIG